MHTRISTYIHSGYEDNGTHLSLGCACESQPILVWVLRVRGDDLDCVAVVDLVLQRYELAVDSVCVCVCVAVHICVCVCMYDCQAPNELSTQYIIVCTYMYLCVSRTSTIPCCTASTAKL